MEINKTCYAVRTLAKLNGLWAKDWGRIGTVHLICWVKDGQ